MLRDLCGSLWGVLVFALALLTPGYVVARIIRLNGFRTAGLREQLAWSVALSFGAGTLFVVACVWICGVFAAGWVLIVLGVVAAILFRRAPLRFDLPCRESVLWLAVALFWTCVVLLSLIDLGIGSRLWMSVTSYDQSVRTAFVGAVMRTGVPPSNPLYWPGHRAPMHYYYFWYVTCATIARLAHISARQALIASCVWTVAGVAAMLALFGRYLLEWRGRILSRRWWLALLLMSVTGLDLLANLGTLLARQPLSGDMEWWSVDQVTSWVDTYLWVPHHAAGLVCCLLTALLLWRCGSEPERRARTTMACLAGISFASAFGLSMYVAAGAVFVLVPWLVWRLFHRDDLRVASSFALATGVAVLLLVPYLLQLLHKEAGPVHAFTAVLGFGVRRIIDPNVLNTLPGLRTLRVHHPFAEINLAALILLLPGYLTELGFYALVLYLATWRFPPKTSGERTLLFWTWAGLIAVTFIRSQVLSSNDYGFRASLLMQFFLLPLSVLMLERSSGWWKRSLLVLAAIGLLGSVYQVVVLRTYLPWQQLHGNTAVAQLAERNFALRDAFAALDARIPRDARVQYDPAPSGSYASFAQMLEANRQIINADPACDTAFGGSTAACHPIQQAVDALYGAVPADGPEAVRLCRQIGANYLIATRWNPVWNDRSDWVWTLTAVLVRPNVRVLACSPSARPSP